MNEKGKALEIFSNDFSKVAPCRKHPKSSSVGICPFCLKERLLKLVCSECGEKRHSSCSCSSLKVGRMSFLLENDINESQQSNAMPCTKSRRRREEEPKQDMGLRRSSSISKEVNEHNGFWVLGRLFRRRGIKIEKDGECFDVKSEFWLSDNDTVSVVSRSRSLCSFRGDDSAKISDVANGILVGSGKQRLLCSESDSEMPKEVARDLKEFDKATKRSVFPSKENDFAIMDESEFFDLSFDLSADSKPGTSTSDHGFSFKTSTSVNETRLKRDGKSNRVWKWIFKVRGVHKEASCINGS